MKRTISRARPSHRAHGLQRQHAFQTGRGVLHFESVGAQLGPHVNASTSFDQTIMLDLPTDKPEAVTGLHRSPISRWTDARSRAGGQGTRRGHRGMAPRPGAGSTSATSSFPISTARATPTVADRQAEIIRAARHTAARSTTCAARSGWRSSWSATSIRSRWKRRSATSSVRCARAARIVARHQRAAAPGHDCQRHDRPGADVLPIRLSRNARAKANYSWATAAGRSSSSWLRDVQQRFWSNVSRLKFLGAGVGGGPLTPDVATFELQARARRDPDALAALAIEARRVREYGFMKAS